MISNKDENNNSKEKIEETKTQNDENVFFCKEDVYEFIKEVLIAFVTVFSIFLLIFLVSM